LHEPLQYEAPIVLRDIPLQWISRIELYYPDLPGFPIVYVHSSDDNRRLYGFPASISYRIKNDTSCDTEIIFLCNVDLKTDERALRIIISQLEERFGISGRFGREEVLAACGSNEEYAKFFSSLWDTAIDRVMGGLIPYGKFYEEIFSIVRFVSAWNPKTGRQSEMRMLYNFLSAFGEKIETRGRWNFASFYLLPTYGDILDGKLDKFPKFSTLLNAMKKIWAHDFTSAKIKNKSLLEANIKCMEKAWPENKEKFIREIIEPLKTRWNIRDDDTELHTELKYLEWLVDAFNRYPRRAAFFVWSIMTIMSKNYKDWDKSFFVDFYLSGIQGGISPKVVACFLQQGFGKDELIPVDTWVESFYKGALGIDNNEDFFKSFSKLGKLERLIWLSSQAKKTNMSEFFHMLWCIRYGVTGNLQIRRANPIACYLCSLRSVCPGYTKISERKVFLRDWTKVRLVTIKNNKGKVVNIGIDERTSEMADNKNCSFICITENGVPKKIFEKREQRANRWLLVDEFSGYRLRSTHIAEIKNDTATVNELLASIKEYTYKDDPEIDQE